MRNFYLATFFIFALNLEMAMAQCPPPGTPTSTNTCPEAQPNCLNLDGYCGTINNNNQQQPFPGCPSNVLNNDEWFAFYAGSTQITIQITPDNCSASGQQGLQGAIYSGCITGTMDTQCPCTENPFLLGSSSFVVGQIYWIVIDGCAGNVCDYSVDVITGSTVAEAPDDPGPVSGNTVVCQNTSSTYSVPPISGATAYQWTLNPSLGSLTTNNNNVTVNWTTPGTAQLCVTSSNVCFANPNASCITVEVLPPPTATISGTGLICSGSQTTVDLSVAFTGGDGPWTFVYQINGVNQAPITTSDNPYTLTVNQAANYTLSSVTYPGSSCVGTVSGSGSVAQSSVLISGTATAEICGQGNGSINITPAPPGGTYTFSWSNGETTEDLANIGEGTYTVTVTNAQGCTATNSFTVADNPINISVTGTVVSNTSCNTDNGSIDISVAPNNPYVYEWSNGATTQDISGLAPGSYTVTVSFGTTCSTTANFTVNDNPNNPSASLTPTASTCELDNGEINLSVSGGVPPYSFAWSNGATTEDLDDIASGTYTVTVTGANGCTDTESTNVGNNNPPISLTATPTPNTTCNGGNGAINLTISPATPTGGGTYSISWSNGETTEDISGLTPGSYSVTVTGNGACTQTTSFNVPDQPLNPSASASTTPSSCSQPNGDINLTPSGGLVPYSFTWSNGATTEDLNDVLAGNYQVTVTGANGCTATASVDLSNNDPNITITPTISPNTACSSSNGSISISVSPAGNYNITWSNGSTGYTITGLDEGSYSVTVDGGGSCTESETFTVPNQPNAPTLSVSATPTNCGQSDGSANVNATGGVAPYNYAWSNGASGPSIVNVPSGSYVVTVTGANGCASLIVADIQNNDINININENITPNTTCAANGNGGIALAITPPAAYTITWSNGATNVSFLNNLPPGTYSVTVDAGGTCVESGTYTVPDEPNEPSVDITPDNANCGLANGGATASGSGGVPGYTYAWSTGATGASINNVLAGNYTVTVTASNQCTGTNSVDILDEDIPISVNESTVDNTSCILPNNGSINLIVSPPTATIQWSNGSQSSNLDNLAPGNYSVTISVGGSCTFSSNYTIFNSSENATLDYSVMASSCGEANGSIDLTVSNGQGPYEYFWSNGWPDEDPQSTPPGTYTVTVTTATGCTTTASVTVPNNNATINLNGTPTSVTSCTINNGGITLTPSPAGNYTYVWSNGATTQNLTNIAAGTYTVTVSSGPACSSTATYQVTNTAVPPNLSTTPTAATCGLPNGSVNLTVTGGTSPYTIAWSNSSSSEDLTNIAEGSYTVTVTGANGCSATASANVGNTNTAPNIAGTPAANTSCTANNGGVNITVTPSGTYTYTWSNSATTEDISNVAAGTYTVTVSAGGSCTATSSFTVADNVSSPIIADDITAAICSQSNGGINLTVTGATTPYTFAWSNSATTEDITNVPPGNYSVTVTGANGCSSNATYNVANNSSSFSLAATEQPLSSCASNNGSVNLTITPAGSYSIVWSNSATTEDINNLPAGTYTVTVTASGSCSASASYVVMDVTESPTLGQNTTPEVCGLGNGGVDLNVSGSTTPYVFTWSNSAITEDLNNIAEGNYTVTVTGANGCSATTSATVPGNTIAFSINGTTTDNTSCDINNGGINVTVSPSGTYMYQWSTNAATEDLNGLTGGTYAVTVSAGGNCTAEADFTVGSTTLDPVISSSITPSECGVNNGAINLSISGGVSPFNFVWASGQVIEDLNNLAAGTYSVEVEGANGCVSTANFTVQDNSLPINIAGTPVANSSCDNPNGEVSINVTPAGVYSYQWSNNMTSEDISGLPPGTYNVTVTTGQTCTAEANFTVGNNTNAPNFSQVVDPASCSLANGGINLTVSGGSMPYSFLWSNNALTEDLSGVAPGNYQVTVTGSDGCANTGDIEVMDNIFQLGVISAPTANTACSAGNGSIDLTVSPAGTYTYVWDAGQTTEDIANLSGGTYIVTVSAGGTCTATSSIVVLDQPDEPTISDQVTPSICGAPDGGINLTVIGGALPYVFVWSNSSTSEDLVGVNSGNYLVTVTASNGCSATGSYNVPNESNTFSFSGLASPNTFCGSGNGGVDITVTPIGVYTFTWSNGESTEDIAGLAPGTYEVTVSDGGTCTASQQFIVGNNAPTVALTGTPTDVLCLGGNNGAINLTPSGGVAPYEFEWSPNLPGNPEDPSGLVAGTYDVTVTDASGCKGTASFTIDEPATATQLLCTQSGNVSLPGQLDGEGTVNINGGTAPYTVDWNPGGQQSGVTPGDFVISNLGIGAYSISVTDANGCPATCGFNVTTDDCITAIGSMSNSLLTTCGSDCITANYSALGSYLDTNDLLQFILHTGTGNQIVNEILRSDQPTFCFADAPLTYGVTYYISAAAGDPDANGNVLLSDVCTQVSAGTPIVFYEIPVASIAQPNPLTCLQSQVQVMGSSSVPGSTYSWATQGGNIVGSTNSQNIQANAPGTYTLTVTSNGCQSTASVNVITIGTVVTANIISSPGEILDCIVSQITLTASVNGTSSPDIVWYQNGQQIGTGTTYPVQAGGTYTVVVTDPPSGCTGTASVTISDNTDYPAVQTNPAPLMNCQDTVVTISGSSPVNGVTFEWVTVSGTDTIVVGTGASAQVNEPGTYYLVGTAPNGCQNGEAVIVTGDFATPTANAGQDAVLDCYETPLDLTGSGSVGVSFYWSTNVQGVTISDPTAPVITVNADGIYTLTVTDLGNHCTDSDDVEVFQYENVPQAEVLAEDPDCLGDTNGSIELNTDPANGPYNFNVNGQDYGSQNYFAPLAPGTYEIEVTDGQGCTWTTQVVITEPEELIVNIGADILVNLGETATIQAQYTVPSSQLDTMIWTPSELLPCPQMPCDLQEFTPTQQTVVTLTIIDENGCEADDLLTVFVKKDNPVYVPNGFSPNGDGTNDVFMIFAGKEVENIKSFLVFDRWGEIVYEYYDFDPNNPAYGWDGTLRGQKMNPAVFAWFAVVEFIDGSEVLLEGDVTLVR